MKIIFNKCIAIVICHLIPLISYGQTISLGFGPIFTQSVQKVKLVNGVNDFQNTGFNYNFKYEHKLKLKNSEIFAFLNYFPGETWITIDKSKAIYEYGNGFKGINIIRLDLCFQYEIIKLRNYFIKVGIGIGNQISRRNGYDPFDSIYEIFGPDYSMNEPITISYNSFQIVPVINFKTGFVTFRRFEVFFNIQGVYGSKSYQTMNLNYSHKGIIQKTAVIEARGTGLFPLFGIGYKIVK